MFYHMICVLSVLSGRVSVVGRFRVAGLFLSSFSFVRSKTLSNCCFSFCLEELSASCLCFFDLKGLLGLVGCYSQGRV